MYATLIASLLLEYMSTPKSINNFTNSTLPLKHTC